MYTHMNNDNIDNSFICNIMIRMSIITVINYCFEGN